MARINLQKLIFRIMKFLKGNRNTVMVVLFALLILDILLLRKTVDGYIGVILAISVAASLLYRLTSRHTFTLCLLLLGSMCGFYIFTGASINTEKAAVWLIFYLVFGTAQRLMERL